MGPSIRTRYIAGRLIYALSRQSKYGEAEAEAREVLRLREKVLGPDNPDTAVSRYNLAEPLVEQENMLKPKPCIATSSGSMKKCSAQNIRCTLGARVGLATVLSSEGKTAEAEPLHPGDNQALLQSLWSRASQYT